MNPQAPRLHSPTQLFLGGAMAVIFSVLLNGLRKPEVENRREKVLDKEYNVKICKEGKPLSKQVFIPISSLCPLSQSRERLGNAGISQLGPQRANSKRFQSLQTCFHPFTWLYSLLVLLFMNTS